MTIIRKCPIDGNEYPMKPYRKYCPACKKGVLIVQEKFGGITMDPKRYLGK